MSERRILTTSGAERVVGDGVIDKLAAGLRGGCYGRATPPTTARAKYGTVWSTSARR